MHNSRTVEVNQDTFNLTYYDDAFKIIVYCINIGEFLYQNVRLKTATQNAQVVHNHHVIKKTKKDWKQIHSQRCQQ